jgi:hypothetical protein
MMPTFSALTLAEPMTVAVSLQVMDAGFLRVDDPNIDRLLA